MSNQSTKNWEKDFEKKFISRLNSLEIIGQSHGMSSWEGETIPDFIKSLLASQKAEILGEMKLEKREPEKFRKGWTYGYNSAVEDLEKLKEKLK